MSPNLTGPATGLFLAEAELVKTEQATATAQPTTAAQPAASTSVQPAAPKPQRKDGYEWQIVWRNVLAFAYLHVGALYGLYLAFTVANVYTILWGK